MFVSASWFWNLVIALFTLSTISYFGGGDGKDEQRVGVAYLYFLFLAILFVDIVFTLVYVPETKSSSSEDNKASLSVSSSPPPSSSSLKEVQTEVISIEGNETHDPLNIELQVNDQGDEVVVFEEIESVDLSRI